MEQKSRRRTRARFLLLALLFVVLTLIPASAKYVSATLINFNYLTNPTIPGTALTGDTYPGFDIVHTVPILVTPGVANINTSSTTNAYGGYPEVRLEGCPAGWYAFELRGGSGGNGNTYTFTFSTAGGGTGGKGATVRGVFFLDSAQTLLLCAGQGGGHNMSSSVNSGLAKYGAGETYRDRGGGGGGFSAIFKNTNSVYDYNTPEADRNANTIAVAGGGGGGGGAGNAGDNSTGNHGGEGGTGGGSSGGRGGGNQANGNNNNYPPTNGTGKGQDGTGGGGGGGSGAISITVGTADRQGGQGGAAGGLYNGNPNATPMIGIGGGGGGTQHQSFNVGGNGGNCNNNRWPDNKSRFDVWYRSIGNGAGTTYHWVTWYMVPWGGSGTGWKGWGSYSNNVGSAVPGASSPGSGDSQAGGNPGWYNITGQTVPVPGTNEGSYFRGGNSNMWVDDFQLQTNGCSSDGTYRYAQVRYGVKTDTSNGGSGGGGWVGGWGAYHNNTGSGAGGGGGSSYLAPYIQDFANLPAGFQNLKPNTPNTQPTNAGSSDANGYVWIYYVGARWPTGTWRFDNTLV